MNRVKIGTDFWIIIVVLLFSAMPVMAAHSHKKNITINPGTLQEVLDDYSKNTGIKTVYLNELIEGKLSPGAKNVSPPNALQQILQGTGLTFQMTANNTAVLKKTRKNVHLQKQKKTKKSQLQQNNMEMKLEEVTVTAQKREENLQKVPISMTVFDKFTIEDSKIESIQDVASYTSNFTLENRGGGVSVPSIRGIVNSSFSRMAPSAGIIIDGIPISNSNSFNETLMDIERIEVLKGPQGTLYGKDAQAGVINIITKQPDNTTRAKIGVELGEDNKRQYTLSASGPIVKNKLFAGVSAKHYEKDGFIKNTLLGGDINDRDNDYGRLHLRYTPTDNLEISLISSRLQRDDGAFDYGAVYTSGEESVSVNEQGYDESSITSHALKVAYDIKNYLLESITTYRNLKADSLQIFDSNFYFDFQQDYKKYSQEFRLSNNSDIFKWVAGVYTDKEEVDESSTYLYPAAKYPFDPKIDGDSLGIFIHTDFAINDKLSFISGARYDNVNREFKQSTTKLDFSDDEISPKISLKYQHDKNSMYYTTISKGYRAGGFSARAPEGFPKHYKKETLWNYEIGAKNIFFNNRLLVNSSVFYMQIDDMQARIYTIPGSNQAYVDNAAKAISKGFEIELNAKLTHSLELFGAYGYTDATFDEYNDGRVDYSGNKTTFAPEYSYNIGVQYRGDQGYFARADVNGYGRTYFDNKNEYSRDPYSLVNAKIGYEQESYDIYLYGKNIFDEEHHSIGAWGGGGVLYSKPREIGVQLVYRF